MNKRVVGAVLAIYVAAVIGAILLFDKESFDNQLVGWVGGLTFGLLLWAFTDARRKNKKESH